MNPEEQEYYDIDEKNSVVLRIIEGFEINMIDKARQLGESIEKIVIAMDEGGEEPIVLELFVKDMALIQNTLRFLDEVKELDVEGYDVAGHLEAILRLNKATDEIKHLGKFSLSRWSVAAAYNKFIGEKHRLEIYKEILDEFNKMD